MQMLHVSSSGPPSSRRPSPPDLPSLRRSRTPLRLVLALLLLPLPAGAQSAGLEALVDSIAEAHVGTTLAGMSVGVVRGGKTLLTRAYGHADLEWDVPMPVDAVHEVGSVTKQFTSVAILQLVGQGRLDLDADLTEVLPEYDTKGRSIPIRRLLDHTSGIKGATEIPGFIRLSPQSLPRDSALAVIQAEPLQFEPGEALVYNNSAFIILGHVIEAVSGQSYEAYLAEHVFPLAGMDDSHYCSNTRIVEKRAHGYAAGPDGLRRAAHHDHTWPFSAGSVCSTVPDLIAWNRALHGGEVLPPRLYELLVTPVPLADGTPVRYAMGLSHYIRPSGRVIEHGGGIDGFLAHSRYYPDDDLTVVVLFNTTGPPGPASVANAVGQHLLGTDHAPVAADFEGGLEPFTGRYRGPARGRPMRVDVAVEDGGLTLSVNGGDPDPIHYLDGATFFRGTTRYTFDVPAGDGQAERLRFDHVGGHYVLERIDEEAAAGVEVSVEVLESYVGRYALRDDFVIEITREGDRLFGQATGQSPLALVADSETEFHPTGVEASIEFVRDEAGEVTALILHQGGLSQRAERVGR